MTHWTPEQDEQLKAAWLDGNSAAKIAAMPFAGGRSRNAVIGRLHRMGCREEGREAHPRMTNRLALPLKPTEPRKKKPIGVRANRPPRPPGFPAPREVTPVDAPLVPNDTWRCQYFTGPGSSDADKCGDQRVMTGAKESPYCALHTALCSNGKPPARRRDPDTYRLKSRHFW